MTKSNPPTVNVGSRVIGDQQTVSHLISPLGKQMTTTHLQKPLGSGQQGPAAAPQPSSPKGASTPKK